MKRFMIGIGAVLVVLALALWRTGSTSWRDLGNNLLTDLIGILVTVGLVNGLIGRERRRQQRQMAHVALWGPLMDVNHCIVMASIELVGHQHETLPVDESLYSWKRCAAGLRDKGSLFSVSLGTQVLEDVHRLVDLADELGTMRDEEVGMPDMQQYVTYLSRMWTLSALLARDIVPKDDPSHAWLTTKPDALIQMEGVHDADVLNLADFKSRV